MLFTPEALLTKKVYFEGLFTPSESEKDQRIKNKRQTSKEIFAFAFAFARSDHSVKVSVNKALKVQLLLKGI